MTGSRSRPWGAVLLGVALLVGCAADDEGPLLAVLGPGTTEQVTTTTTDKPTPTPPSKPKRTPEPTAPPTPTYDPVVPVANPDQPVDLEVDPTPIGTPSVEVDAS